VERERKEYKNAGLAPRTISSYEADWRVFTRWCEVCGRTSLPASPDTVELYVTDLLHRGRAVTTVERHAISIQYKHRLAGEPSPRTPELAKLISGARRLLCQAPKQKSPLLLSQLKAILRRFPNTPIGARDRAVLAFGWASALRRSTLAALQLKDLTFSSEGVTIWIRGEKQDRQGNGREVAVPRGVAKATCPVAALERWIRYRGKTDGPLFQRVMRGHPNGKPILGNRICQIVQEGAASIGLDRHCYGAHSLRAGLVTEGLEQGVNELAIARQTGHASLSTLRLYSRSRDLFRGNAVAAMGL
jgi:integrase